ncbi:hypothetical protein BD410DRAFT_777074 [Rickenella mellea]|uniref:DUF155 domain-containing protein n=1 Tax=Rickenella mellea TaxID=50990 RepID=A0A4Y7PN73_9AGAM|nr:hypothetical protein BD410DRAFT_777074 [Rickenella mellea]
MSPLLELRAGFFKNSSCLRLGLQSTLPRPALRYYAVEAAVPEKSRPKPKAATQLRRTAAASLPIRSNPTPTRGDIRPVSVLTTAERYKLPLLRPKLPYGSQVLHEAWWIPRWGKPGSEGEVFVFENGSFVCWGLEEKEATRFVGEVIRKSRAEVDRLLDPETEDVEFVTDPNEDTRLQGDLIILGRNPEPNDPASLPTTFPEMVLPKETLLARYSFSQGLARSTALSALETSLDEYLFSVSALPTSLSKTGKPSLGRRELIMKLGELLKFRQGLNLTRENFQDTPDFYWAEPVLEGYFNSVTEALDLNPRTRLVNDKITYAAEVQSVLRQLITETSSHRMELIIILLIAVEVVICLIRDGSELWEMLRDKEKSNVEKIKRLVD